MTRRPADERRGGAGRLPGAVCLCLLLARLAACAPVHAPPPVPSTPDLAQENALFLRVNAHRDSLRRVALRYDPELANLARRHSEEMAAGVVPVGHARFSARAMTARQLGYLQVAENVGVNDYPPELAARVAFEGFIHSPRHRQALEGDFTFSGVGMARGARGRFYFTQLYAR